MEEPDQLSKLIGAIYDAALDPDAWPGALAGFADFVGGRAAMIFWQDCSLPEGGRYVSWGDDPDYTSSFFSDYVELNPIAAIQVAAPVGLVLASSDFLSQTQVRRTRFYDEWMRPQRYLDNVFCNIDVSARRCAGIAVARDERDGLIDVAARRCMTLLTPHVRRAVLIGNMAGVGAGEPSASRTLLDSIASGIFLMSLDGKIVDTNQSADAMLEEGDAVSSVGGQLRVADRQAEARFQTFLRAANHASAISGVSKMSMSLTGRSGRDYVAHVLPLDQVRRRTAFDTSRAEAAVFIRPAEIDANSGVEILVRRHKLTPREAQILHAIVEVGGVPEVAAKLGITARTVKTHLHNVFAKTGIDRQADLVHLVAAFSNSP